MADPKPDTRPTIDLGTKYRVSKATAAKAAADLRAGQARAAKDSTAGAYRRKARARAKASEGYGQEMRRRRNNPSPTTVGPTADQYQWTTE